MWAKSLRLELYVFFFQAYKFVAVVVCKSNMLFTQLVAMFLLVSDFLPLRLLLVRTGFKYSFCWAYLAGKV